PAACSARRAMSTATRSSGARTGSSSSTARWRRADGHAGWKQAHRGSTPREWEKGPAKRPLFPAPASPAFRPRDRGPPPLGGEIEARRLLLSRCVVGEAGDPQLRVEQQLGDGLAFFVPVAADRVEGQPGLQVGAFLGEPLAQFRELLAQR